MERVIKIVSTQAIIDYLETHNSLSAVKDVGGPLTLELHHVHLLGRKPLGITTIPLHSIRHSNRVLMLLDAYTASCSLTFSMC